MTKAGDERKGGHMIRSQGGVAHRRRMNAGRALLLLTSATLLSGCGTLLGLSGIGGPSIPSTIFDLAAPPPRSESDAQTQARRVIVVPEPTALRWLESDRVALKPTATIVNYYADAQWSDRLPRLVQARIIEALESAAGLGAIGRPSDGLTPDHQLVLDIRAFELRVTPNPTAVVTITAKLVNIQEGRTTMARAFTTRVPAASDKVVDAVASLETALGQTILDLVTWATPPAS